MSSIPTDDMVTRQNYRARVKQAIIGMSPEERAVEQAVDIHITQECLKNMAKRMEELEKNGSVPVQELAKNCPILNPTKEDCGPDNKKQKSKLELAFWIYGFPALCLFSGGVLVAIINFFAVGHL